jgi:hypothetical protein
VNEDGQHAWNGGSVPPQSTSRPAGHEPLRRMAKPGWIRDIAVDIPLKRNPQGVFRKTSVAPVESRIGAATARSIAAMSLTGWCDAEADELSRKRRMVRPEPLGHRKVIYESVE